MSQQDHKVSLIPHHDCQWVNDLLVCPPYPLSTITTANESSLTGTGWVNKFKCHISMVTMVCFFYIVFVDIHLLNLLQFLDAMSVWPPWHHDDSTSQQVHKESTAPCLQMQGAFFVLLLYILNATNVLLQVLVCITSCWYLHVQYVLGTWRQRSTSSSNINNNVMPY